MASSARRSSARVSPGSTATTCSSAMRSATASPRCAANQARSDQSSSGVEAIGRDRGQRAGASSGLPAASAHRRRARGTIPASRGSLIRRKRPASGAPRRNGRTAWPGGAWPARQRGSPRRGPRGLSSSTGATSSAATITESSRQCSRSAAIRSVGDPDPPDLAEQPAHLVEPPFPEQQLGQGPAGRHRRGIRRGAPAARKMQLGIARAGPGSGPAAGPARAGPRPATRTPSAPAPRRRRPRRGRPSFASHSPRRYATSSSRGHQADSRASRSRAAAYSPSAIRCRAQARPSRTCRPPTSSQAIHARTTASKTPKTPVMSRDRLMMDFRPRSSASRSPRRVRRVRSYHRRQPHRESGDPRRRDPTPPGVE